MELRKKSNNQAREILMKKVPFYMFMFCLMSSIFSDDIKGFWKTINEEGKAQCIIAVYGYGDVYYGRIIGTFDDNGKMDDTIYHPVKRAPGVVGTPFYSGLDIIWGLVDVGVKYKGKILDPEKGNIYNSEMWVDNDGNLIVRGKYMVFGRSQKWFPAEDGDFPKDFKKPNLDELVPSIPQVN
jgi:uncharacterized protein (DUF2147 family)